MAGRVGVQHNAAESKDLSRDESARVANLFVDDKTSHRFLLAITAELSMKAPMSVSKLADLG